MGLFSKKTTIATHNGKFHADEIFACATLQIVLNNKAKIIRTRIETEIEKADYVVDVGGIYSPEKKRFDHHMTEGAGIRSNGISYASFGLVWKEYGQIISGSLEIALRIDEKLVAPIDADDNAIALYDAKGDIVPYTLQGFLYSYRPTWKESDDIYDSAFIELVDLAQKIILREVKIAKDAHEGEAIVEKAYANASDKRIIELPTNCPWQETLIKYPEPLFVIVPRRGTPGFGVNAVPKGTHTFENRKTFPSGWAGLRDEELAKITGVSDALFCHRALFLAVAKSKEGALALAKLSLE